MESGREKQRGALTRCVLSPPQEVPAHAGPQRAPTCLGRRGPSQTSQAVVTVRTMMMISWLSEHKHWAGLGDAMGPAGRGRLQAGRARRPCGKEDPTLGARVDGGGRSSLYGRPQHGWRWPRASEGGGTQLGTGLGRELWRGGAACGRTRLGPLGTLCPPRGTVRGGGQKSPAVWPSQPLREMRVLVTLTDTGASCGTSPKS